MKKIIVIAIVALGLAGCTNARQWQYGTVGGVGGALVGGPVGAVVGAGGGVLLADRTGGRYYIAITTIIEPKLRLAPAFDALSRPLDRGRRRQKERPAKSLLPNIFGAPLC